MNWTAKLKNCSLSDIENKLGNDSDQFEITDGREVKLYNINNSTDIMDYIRAVAKQYIKNEILQDPGEKVEFYSMDIVKILSKSNLIKMRVIKSEIDTTSEKSYWIKDYDNIKWLYKPVDIDMLIKLIYDELNLKYFKSVSSRVKWSLDNMSSDMGLFKLLNEPPSHIILTNNGIFDTETYTLTTENEHNYDFINKLDYRILTPNQVDQNYYKTIKTLFNNCCDKSQDKVLYLKQVALATLDGKGRDCYHVIVSDNDNGKSAYLHMLERLANGCFVNLNMNEIIKDNNLVNVNDSTKLIAGYELPANAKLSDQIITRLKMFVAGETFLINVRYKRAKYVRMTGVKIQATNNLPKELKNKSILTDRLNIFEWTNVNHRKFDRNLKLDLLLDDPDFIEAFIAWIFTDTGVFEKFIEIN